MFASVVDQSGAPVPNVGPGDLIVREDNLSREVLRVEPAVEPMQIALLVDNSTAAKDAIPDMRRALPGFVDALLTPSGAGLKNQVSLVALAERPTILVNYTSDPKELHRGIERLWDQSMSGNYLLDATIEVLQGFKKREATRPVIVAIVTEGPELSNRHYQDVLDALRASTAEYDVIMLGRPSGAIDDQARSRDLVVSQGPEITGGSYDQLLTSMALGNRLQQLAAVLTHEYKVTYAHPDSLIPPEKVTVSARRAGVVARGRLTGGASARP